MYYFSIIFLIWFLIKYLIVLYKTRKTPAFGGISLALREGSTSGAAFVSPSAAVKEKKKIKRKNWDTTGAPLGAAAYAAFGGDKKKSGASGAPNGFKNFTRAMRIPNMCLVLKFPTSRRFRRPFEKPPASAARRWKKNNK